MGRGFSSVFTCSTDKLPFCKSTIQKVVIGITD